MESEVTGAWRGVWSCLGADALRLAAVADTGTRRDLAFPSSDAPPPASSLRRTTEPGRPLAPQPLQLGPATRRTSRDRRVSQGEPSESPCEPR